jgi:hypothetical protein
MRDPSARTAYEVGYDTGRREMAGRPLPLLYQVLRSHVVLARTEIDFGIVDALADLVREATGAERLYPPIR